MWLKIKQCMTGRDVEMYYRCETKRYGEQNGEREKNKSLRCFRLAKENTKW